MSQFLYHNDDKDDAKVKAIPRVFCENSQAKNCIHILSKKNLYPLSITSFSSGTQGPKICNSRGM